MWQQNIRMLGKQAIIKTFAEIPFCQELNHNKDTVT